MRRSYMKRAALVKAAQEKSADVREDLEFADAELHAKGFYSAVPYRSTVRGHVRRALKWLDGKATLTSGAAQQLRIAIDNIANV